MLPVCKLVTIILLLLHSYHCMLAHALLMNEQTACKSKPILCANK